MEGGVAGAELGWTQEVRPHSLDRLLLLPGVGAAALTIKQTCHMHQHHRQGRRV